MRVSSSNCELSGGTVVPIVQDLYDRWRSRCSVLARTRRRHLDVINAHARVTGLPVP